MRAIQISQWLVASAVLSYGVLLFGSLGVMAAAIVVAGLLLCGLAAWTSRLTMTPVFLSIIVDAVLAWLSWRLLSSTIDGVRANAEYQHREISFDQYVTLDAAAALAVLCLVTVYFASVISNWKRLQDRTSR